MGCLDFGIAVAAERRVRRWDQERLGEELGRLSTKLGAPMAAVTPETVSRWENGRHWPKPWLAWLLCKLFDRLPSELYLDHIVTPEVAARYDKATRDRDFSPLSQLDMVSGVADGGEVRDLERLAQAIHNVGPVDAIAAADMRVVSDTLIAQRGRIGNRLLLVKLHQHLAQLHMMMGRALSHHVRRELAYSAATTAVVAANIWQWTADHGAAREMLLHARLLAAEAGASVVDAMADFVDAVSISCARDIFKGHRSAVDILDHGERALAGSVDPCFSTILYGARAKHYAALGCEPEARRDLDVADRELARWAGQPTGLFSGMDSTFALACRAKTALLLGRPVEAVEHWEAAVAAAQGWLLPAYRVNLAAAYGQAGLPEQAAALLMGILDEARETRTLLPLTWVGNVIQHELVPFRDVPTVRQLTDALVG